MTGWTTATLDDIATIVRGISFKPEDVVSVGTPGSVACMRTKNVQGELDCSDVWAVGADFVRRKEQFLETGDVLISSANSWNLVGKCAWVPHLPWRATFGGFVSVLRPQRGKVHPRYLFHWFASDRTQATVRSFGQQTTNISNLNIERCLRLSLPLPPLADQERIAEVLDRADALRAKRRLALTQLDTLTQAIFLALFGEFAGKGWPLVTISDVAHPSPGSIRTGPFGSQLLHSEFVDEGIVVLGIDNVVSNEFRPGERRFITEAKYLTLKRYTVRPGDVLITIMGTCGRCAVVPDHVPLAINTKHLCCITVDTAKCLPGYLHSYFLRHPLARRYLERTVKGAIMAGLNMAIIKEMPIPIPPIDIQREFGHRAAGVEKLRASQRSSLANLDALFASLQHRAFRGGF